MPLCVALVLAPPGARAEDTPTSADAAPGTSITNRIVRVMMEMGPAGSTSRHEQRETALKIIGQMPYLLDREDLEAEFDSILRQALRPDGRGRDSFTNYVMSGAWMLPPFMAEHRRLRGLTGPEAANEFGAPRKKHRVRPLMKFVQWESDKARKAGEAAGVSYWEYDEMGLWLRDGRVFAYTPRSERWDAYLRQTRSLMVGGTP